MAGCLVKHRDFTFAVFSGRKTDRGENYIMMNFILLG
jgi:hypothetical protein